MQIKTCAKCGESRPLKEFSYLATYAQSKAWGRAGNVRMTLESKNCKACRPKRKAVSQLTKKEILNKVRSGEMSIFTAKILRSKQKQAEHNKQAMAARKRWLKVWKAELKEVLAPITKEIVSARNAHLYARAKGYGGKDKFYFEYMGMLKRAKDFTEMSYMVSPRRPASARWADYVGDAVFSRVRDLWAALPPVYKHSRIPLLIKHRPDGQ